MTSSHRLTCAMTRWRGVLVKVLDYLGWSCLPSGFSDTIATEIISIADSIRNICDAFIVVGIGGSYLGSRAGISYLSSSFSNQFGMAGCARKYTLLGRISVQITMRIFLTC